MTVGVLHTRITLLVSGVPPCDAEKEMRETEKETKERVDRGILFLMCKHKINICSNVFWKR